MIVSRFKLCSRIRFQKVSFYSSQSTDSTANLGSNEAQTSTINEHELSKFKAVSNSWWDRNGEAKALHSMNKLRIPFIRDGILSTQVTKAEKAKSNRSLAGYSILDVGCGGGLLSEALARIGANVTGIDAVAENIEIAQGHALADPLLTDLTYITSTVEEHKFNFEGNYDAVVASEVIEHVENPQFFVASCAALTKPGGSLFITTINRTQLSWITAIVGAEYILRILPKGIHDWNKFVSPDELEVMLTSSGFQPVKKHGMLYNFLANDWVWTKNTDVNFAIHAVKTLKEKEVQEAPEKLDEDLSGERQPAATSGVTSELP
ncbi:ubiquinone biosynthesis O-methyltransferase, mitochondrial-like isoform X1 [Artemia franciscana]